MFCMYACVHVVLVRNSSPLNLGVCIHGYYNCMEVLSWLLHPSENVCDPCPCCSCLLNLEWELVEARGRSSSRLGVGVRQCSRIRVRGSSSLVG